MLDTKINTFIKVAELGSFSKTSEELFISKVSVMNQINALEDELELKLFERTHSGVKLTPSGDSFYKNALRLKELTDQAIKEAKELDTVTSKTIRIGTSIMRPCNLFLDQWEKIDNKNFQFEIIPFNDNVDGFNQMLEHLGKDIDIFITPCGTLNTLENYNFLQLNEIECRIALSKKHPLAQRPLLKLTDLEGQSLLLIKEGNSFIVDEIRHNLKDKKIDVNIIDYEKYYDLNVFNECENKGYLMETLSIWNTLHPSLISLPVEWDHKMPYGIMYSKHPSKQVQEFIDSIKVLKLN